MPAEIPILAVLAASSLGGLLGFLTGLVPGLHSNNVASAIGGGPGLLVAAVTAGMMVPGAPGWELVAASAVVAAAVAHTIANIVPSIYFAVPEGDDGMSLLPGHRMTRAGRGGEALRVSVTSSLTSLALSLAILAPLLWVMGPPLHLYRLASPWFGPGLLLVSTAMIIREGERAGRRARPWSVVLSLMVFVVAGALGQVALFELNLVAPLFIGLFGVSTMLLGAMGNVGEVPAARVERPDPPVVPWWSVVRGTFAGATVGWLPGVSPAQATILAVPSRVGGDGDPMHGTRRFIAGVSAVNTANAVFNLAALAMLLRVRSGSAQAVAGIMAWDAAPWSGGALHDPSVAILFLAAALGGAIAAPLTLWAGDWARRLSPRLSRRGPLLLLALAMLAITVVFGDWTSGLVLGAATLLGVVPPLLGLMRVHLMGAVTLPLILAMLSP